MQKFPNRSKLVAFFCPGRWSYCVENLTKCLTAPCITLAQVRTLFKDADLARELVTTQITGLYAMTTGNYQMNTAAVQQAAEYFCAHYGKTCTLYDMMLYFAHYTLEFKGVSYQFDLQDIIRQYKQKYTSWKTRQDTRPEERKALPVRENQVTGHAALVEYAVRLMRDGESDEQIRQHTVYDMGLLTEKDILRAREIVNDTF